MRIVVNTGENTATIAKATHAQVGSHRSVKSIRWRRSIYPLGAMDRRIGLLTLVGRALFTH